MNSSAPRPATDRRDRRPCILVWSGWDAFNLGDLGHTPGLLALIERHVPEARVTVCANMLRPAIRALLARRFPQVEVFQGGLLGRAVPSRRVRAAIAASDLFLRASNMGGNTEFMEYLAGRGKAFGIFGQTYQSWFAEGPGAPERLAALARARFVFCRETLTLKLLRRARLRGPHLAFVPDCCFGVDVRDERAGAALLRRHGLEPRRFITVQLRTHTPAHAPGQLPPGYRPEWNQRPPNEPLDRRRADVFIDFIVRWVRRTGHRVLIAPEAKKEMAHNRRLIHDRMPAAERAHVVNLDEFWHLEVATAVFGQAHTVVCHEPHSPILALAQGTPILHPYSLEHSGKYRMFADLGLGDWALELDRSDGETLERRMVAIDRDYAGARARVAAAMDRVRAGHARAFARIRRTLAET